MKRSSTKVSFSILIIYLFILAEGLVFQNAGGQVIPIIDATGSSVEVRLPVKRICVLTSDALEVIRALRAEDFVVGVNSGIAGDPLFWPRLKNRQSVGRWNEPNYELIAELNPDIVIAYARWPGRGMEKKLAPFGIQVVRLNFYKIATIEDEVETLGRILNREREALRLAGWYRKNLTPLKEGLKGIKHRPDVYIEGYSDYHMDGPGSGGNEMCLMAGGRNIASGFSIPYPETTPEWVLARNPQVVIKAAAFSHCYTMAGPGPFKRVRNKIMKRPAWANILAVKTGMVHVMSGDIWTGPRGIIGTSYMARWFFPVIFRNLDPEKLHSEYLNTFQGIKYQGVYVYPERAPG